MFYMSLPYMVPIGSRIKVGRYAYLHSNCGFPEGTECKIIAIEFFPDARHEDKRYEYEIEADHLNYTQFLYRNDFYHKDPINQEQ